MVSTTIYINIHGLSLHCLPALNHGTRSCGHGSIGAISTGGISEIELKNFYSGKDELLAKASYEEEKTTGSNGFAFSPKITESGNAILYINPHVTFYFRPEVHMVSKEGMNAYGAVTWGQPFVYQGFNEHCG